MAAPGGGGGCAGVLPASLDPEDGYPGYCTQPPLQMLRPPTDNATQEQQTGGSPAARGAGAPDDPGSGDVAGEQLQASQEDGRGSRGATQQQQLSAHKDVWVDDADSEVPHWALQQQPAALAQPGSLLASHQHLFALPGTPRQLMFAIRAALEQRGDPETRLGSLEMLVPHDQDNTQCMGVSQDTWVSQDARAQADLEAEMLSLGADAGDGYYLFRREMQKQLGELWALTEQLASRLEEATAALEQQRAQAQEPGGATALEEEVVRESQQKLTCALTENKQLTANLRGKDEEFKAVDMEANDLVAELDQLEQTAAEREAALQRQLEQANEAAAEREAALQRQLEQANEAAAEREAALQRQLEQANGTAAEREAALQRQLEQANEAAAEREAELQRQLEQASRATAVGEATLQRQQQAAVAAAKREAALQQQLEQANEAAAEREAELQQEVEQARRQAGEQADEGRQLRQQLAELQRTRQKELADAEGQQEVAAEKQRRLVDKMQRWKARCQAAEQQAAQMAAVAEGSGQQAAELEAAVAECSRLQRQLAAVEQQNVVLQAASAEVLARVQQVVAAAEAHAQGTRAAADASRAPTSAAPVPEPQVDCDELSHEQLRELKRFLTDPNYQQTKLGGAYQPMRALRDTAFWRGVAEGLQAPLWLVQMGGFRLLAEMALAGQQAAEAAAAQARRSEKMALQQARRAKAAVEAVQRATAAQQPTCSTAGSSGGQQRGGQRRREAQDGHGYDLWELLVELGQRDEELLEAHKELEREREASSCKAWQLVYEAQEAQERACQRARQLEAQLARSLESVQRLREAAAQLQHAGEEQAAKRARCGEGGAVLPGGGQALAAASGSWEDAPADSEAGPVATAAAGPTQAVEQLGWTDAGAHSLAGAAASPQLQLAEPAGCVEQSVRLGAQPAAAAAQVQQDGRLDAAAPPAAGGSQAAPAPATSSTHAGVELQGRPPMWDNAWLLYMTPALMEEHGAFAPLVAVAYAVFGPPEPSAMQSGSDGGRGSKKRGCKRKAAA